MRGLKNLLRTTAPAKLGQQGGFKCFRTQSRCFKGITKLLNEKIYSSGTPQSDAQWRGGAWAGKSGGRRRGTAVDSQVTRVVNRGGVATLKLAKTAMSSLEQHGMIPLVAQRVVVDHNLGLASAVDVLALQGDALVLVELKCGFSGDRTRPVLSRSGCPFSLAAPLSKAADTIANRHLAQLTATLTLFCNETDTLKKVKKLGVDTINAALLYVDGEGSELFFLPSWWIRGNRGRRILEALASHKT